MSDFGLKRQELCLIRNVLKKNPKIDKAVIFGSRAKGDYRSFSDVDLAVYGDINAIDIESAICELDELPTVYTFDLLAYGLLKNAALKSHIDRVGVAIYDRG